MAEEHGREQILCGGLVRLGDLAHRPWRLPRAHDALSVLVHVAQLARDEDGVRRDAGDVGANVVRVAAVVHVQHIQARALRRTCGTGVRVGDVQQAVHRMHEHITGDAAVAHDRIRRRRRLGGAHDTLPEDGTAGLI